MTDTKAVARHARRTAAGGVVGGSRSGARKAIEGGVCGSLVELRKLAFTLVLA